MASKSNVYHRRCAKCIVLLDTLRLSDKTLVMGQRIDAAAAMMVKISPRRLHRFVDQTRLDINTIIERPSPLLRQGLQSTPPPKSLSEVEVLDLLPRTLATPAKRWSRDAVMVFRTLSGSKASPTISRPRSARTSTIPTAPRVDQLSSRKSAIEVRNARVVRVQQETPDAASIYLDLKGLKFQAGQFFTIIVNIDGNEHRRAYSIASPAIPGASTHITIKRVVGGLVSNFLLDSVKAGDSLKLLGPSGNFSCVPRVEASAAESATLDLQATRNFVFFAGGSGITPIISILQTLLVGEPNSKLYLVFGNRSHADTIFRNRLEALEKRHPQRLVVQNIVQEGPSESDLSGVMNPQNVERALALLRKQNGSFSIDGVDTFFVCGPTKMMQSVKSVLAARGIQQDRVKEEVFASLQSVDTQTEPQLMRVRDRGHVVDIKLLPNQTLLEGGLTAGVDMPFSCTMGGCGACKVKVVRGEVAMQTPNCLLDEEHEQGFVLACVSRACSAVTIDIGGES